MIKTCIQKIATGPEYSKDLSFDETRLAMQEILAGETDPVETAIFLLALRMKRETDTENLGILQALQDNIERVIVPIDALINIADPYDGFSRCLPVSPFLAPLLAACGLPSLAHGLESLTPKYGLTHRAVLKSAGIQVDLTPQQAAEHIANPAIGWAYLDQQQYCPALHNLIPVRNTMIKRSVLATVERLCNPVSATGNTHLLIGYVHKAYSPVYATLARQAGFTTATIVRGVEGSVTPSLRDSARLHLYNNMQENTSIDSDPNNLGICRVTRAHPIPDDIADNSLAICQTTVQTGLEALAGTPGIGYDSLAYTAGIALYSTGYCDSLQEATQQARDTLTSGEAMKRFTSTH